MEYIDTHSHIYLEQFDNDRDIIINKAIDNGINKMVLPNIDKESIELILNLAKKYPCNIYPLIGLHPTHVKEDYKEQLDLLYKYLNKEIFNGIGEVGIDLYWDKTFFNEQKIAFKEQIKWSKEQEMPLIIHSRSSFNEIYEIIKQEQDGNLYGIFHCFSGNCDEAEKIIDLGFHLGIGGVITFKNSGLDIAIKNIDLKNIVLETDSPYLAPTPFRGQRNESSYLNIIANKIAEVKNIDLNKVVEITTNNAKQIFNIK